MTEDEAVKDEESVARVFPLLAQLNDDWVGSVVRIWTALWHESAWSELLACPYNPVAPSVSLVSHVCQVTDGALELAIVAEKWSGVAVDRQVVIAAGLLHDASKLVEYEPAETGGARKSEFGRLNQHATYAAHKAQEEGLPEHVVEIVINHTVQAVEVPQTVEALCVYYADMCAADIARLIDGAPLAVAAHKKLG